MTSNGPKTTQTKSKSNKKRNLKAGSTHENIEINDQYLDEILDNNDIQMDLAMQIISTDKIVRSDPKQDLKEFNNQSLATQAKKGEQLVSMMTGIKKTFKVLSNDIVELTTETDALKKNRVYYEKWLEESKARLLQQIDDEKRANLVMSEWKNRWKNDK